MKMMKTTITILLTGFIGMAGVKAQTIQDGINHLYADRDKSAKSTFEKLVATNPNNLEAVYWLGQSEIALLNVAGAKDLYSKTLQANGNAPLIMVGMGHTDLINGDKDKARQLFETAITLSTGKKGPDPVILNAIGRANIDAKSGDAVYAIEKLKLATEKAPANGDIFMNLGDAYRKVHEGGNSVVSYDKALAATPTLARAAYRKGMIYYTQKNWELFEQFLKQAITIDPKFAPAYYDLYYYYLGKQDFTTAQDNANNFIANSDPDPQNDYLVAQTCYAKKDYDCAINTAKSIQAKSGAQTKPRVLKLLGYATLAKADTAGAKKYMDDFFAVAKDDDIVGIDYITKAQIEGALTGNESLVIEGYEKAFALDTSYAYRYNTLIDARDLYKKQNKKCLEAAIGMMMLKVKRNPIHTDLFNPGLAYYFCGNLVKADSVLQAYIKQYPDSIYGHYWDAIANLALDTTLSQEPYISNIINGFRRTLEIGIKEKDKFKSQGIRASSYLAAIYNNTKKDKDSAIFFVERGLEFDPANASLIALKDQLMKAPKQPARGNNTKPTGSTSPANKPATASGDTKS